MKNPEIPGSVEAWEDGSLGRDEQFARKASKELSDSVDQAVAMQMISIRLDREVIEKFKLLASFHNIGYQPLMRDALQRFADAELKAIVSGWVKQQEQKKGRQPHVTHPPMKKAA